MIIGFITHQRPLGVNITLKSPKVAEKNLQHVFLPQGEGLPDTTGPKG